ncbi:hypothetical protein LshimejAT787_1601160 [Lyophyllum shimeji]|uniref:F-box domain-containing protein n=1 Tax=Lyophyllum shimeji TaxID=47721 RepID=A0A9P3UVI6_LYOSH|nr:hypothetical protein LshimejAT787_1601160 [Lyophyllum shimeji]
MSEGHASRSRSSLSQTAISAPNCSTALDDIAITAASHNNILPETVQTRARLLLSKASDSLLSLDQQIAEVQTKLNDLLLWRCDTVTEMDIYRSAVAPLRKLLNELIFHIFVHCCISASVTTPYVLQEQPWILGRVCSKWRKISLNTPELWSRINVVVPDHDTKLATPVVRYSTFSAMVTEVIRRSGHEPLSLSIVGDSRGASNLFELIFPHLDRIEELLVYVGGCHELVKNFLALPPGLIPHLRRVDIAGAVQQYSGQITVFQDAPKLQGVAYCLFTTTSAWIFELPLSRLTRLVIPGVPMQPNQVLCILSLTPHLVECYFAVRGATAEVPCTVPSFGDVTTTLVHNLQSLYLTLYAPDIDVSGLQRLVLPQLRHFMLQAGLEREWDAGWGPAILRSGLLEMLSLKDAIVSLEQLESLLHATPHLVELDISSGRMLTSTMLLKMANGTLVPKLSTLKCLICMTGLDDLGALELHLDMLEHRKRATNTAHIGHLWFVFLGREEADISMFPGLARMTKMNEEGWNIVRMWH